jgi:hypothetical protein
LEIQFVDLDLKLVQCDCDLRRCINLPLYEPIPQEGYIPFI